MQESIASALANKLFQFKKHHRVRSLLIDHHINRAIFNLKEVELVYLDLWKFSRKVATKIMPINGEQGVNH